MILLGYSLIGLCWLVFIHLTLVDKPTEPRWRRCLGAVLAFLLWPVLVAMLFLLVWWYDENPPRM